MKNLFPTQSALAALRNRQVWERVLKNKIPRQGTETFKHRFTSLFCERLKNKIPRQGTETQLLFAFAPLLSFIEK